MNIFYKSMAIVLSLSAGLQAMEVEGEGTDAKSEQGQILQEVKKRELTPTEKQNAHKMWLLKQAIDEGTLTWVPEDIRIVIGGKLYELYLYANPVLCGQLVYTGKPEKATFKIADLVKEGRIDLSNKDIFEDTADKLLITLDPALFFQFDEKSIKLLILIAPKSLIEDKIETTASNFKPIMKKWNAELAPIGIFYRMGYWKNLSWIDYLTHENLVEISKKNFFENWLDAEKGRWPCISGGYAHLLKKFHVYFHSTRHFFRITR